MTRASTVFVVAGHNTQARDAMFAFLRSLNLHPLEWDQAVQLTGLPTPFTYDVVRVGMDHAQCAVVLFTGDDAAKLRTEYGSEPESYQPRPNVIFEAGWAFAIGGRERTIIVTFGTLRPFSDLSGLTFLPLDNSASSRQRLVQHLKLAECELTDNGTDFLDPTTGGDFDLRYSDFASEKSLLDRGVFTDFIVDSSLSHTLNNLGLYRELCDYLSAGAKINLKFNYLGTLCASNWLTLSQDPTYGHSELQDVIKGHTAEIVENCEFSSDRLVDFISLGPGDGIIDKNLIFRLQKNATLGSYYPLDLSLDLLQMASSEIVQAKWFQKPFKMKAIHGDFGELVRYKPIYGYDSSINFFALVGYSLGNHEEPELLGKIREGMQPGDLLLLDARLHQLEGFKGGRLTKDYKDQVLPSYHHQLNNRFAFGPVETATFADFRATEFSYDVNNSVTAVPEAINIITCCRNLNTKFRHNYRSVKRPRLNLAVTALYSYEALSEWLPTRGFSLLWRKRTKTTGLFLLRKTDTD